MSPSLCKKKLLFGVQLLVFSSTLHAFAPLARPTPSVMSRLRATTDSDTVSPFPAALLSLVLLSGFPHALPSHAVMPSDDVVISSIRALRTSAGDPIASLDAMKDVRDIIADGKGLGDFARSGLNSEEDASVYDPGLSILSDYEKNEILEAAVENRREGIQRGRWSEDDAFGFEYIRGKLDPLHMMELKSYLGIFPVVGGLAYLGAFAVQQKARPLFITAYIAMVLMVFGPMAVLVLLGS